VTGKLPCSIIIPVHNKAALTRQCLDSIFASPSEVEAEVIVVDDASTDSTAAMLESYGDRVRSVMLKRNSGFAKACNAGAGAAHGRYLVFLNNDTIIQDGWLDTLVDYADVHPEASVVGSRLLYPNGTIQHAGVVFTVSGDPVHIYTGFPGDHPAVTKSRRFQVVTAACMLIRAEIFRGVDGFDTDYHNDLEDVDLCLRLGERGHQVHYCHTSVVVHLEQASRAFRFHEGRSARIYRRRWGPRVRSDELDYYLEDGLLELLRFSPDLVKMDRGRRQPEAELMQIRSRQLLALLRETIRAASYGPDDLGTNGRGRLRISPRRSRRRGQRGLLRGSRGSERVIAELRSALGSAVEGPWTVTSRTSMPEVPGETTIAGGPRPDGYAGVVADVKGVVEAVTPEGATVLVASRGDEELVALGGRRGWHFPRAEDGRYRGYYPEGDEDAVAHLEELRKSGAEFLAFPKTSLWWLQHYRRFAQVLNDRYRVAARTEGCIVFDLGNRADHALTVESMSAGDYERLVGRVRRGGATIAPADARVVSISKGDERLVDIPGRRGWHFPRAEDGRYAGHYPADDNAALSHLEALREQGAGFLVLPASGFWWLDHYAGFFRELRKRYPVAASTDDCLVFDIRASVEQPSATGSQARVPRADTPSAPAPHLSADAYGKLVERVRALVQATVTPGATVLVVSRGDEDLVAMPGYRGWHFPRAADGRYRGYYPANDEEAISHLEELRSAGAEYLVFPSVASWWLNHYPAFAAHLRERYVTAAYDHDTAVLFGLHLPLEASVVEHLIPKGSRLAVSTSFRGDLGGLTDYDAVQLAATTDEEAIVGVEELTRQGVEFLLIPRSGFGWQEEHFAFGEYLRGRHRFVTHQHHSCEIWELQPTSEPDRIPEPAGVPGGEATRPEDRSDRRIRVGARRLWWRLRGNRGTGV
jgi:GT2 family glycosyltransferase